jgi:predicted metal-dependent phosphoesterase TrpH
VQVLALTDHDTVDGLPAAERAADDHSLCLIPGVELSVNWGKQTLHIVGLGFDPASPAMQDAIGRNTAEREDRAARIARRLDKAGIAGSLAGARAQAGEGAPGRMHFARHLVQSGVVARHQDAFRRYLGRGKPACVASHWIGMAAGIEAINAAGGVAVFAHPLRYGMTRTRCREAVAAFAQAGGEAIEVVGGTDGPNDRSSAMALARREGLLASLGSDFHDPDFPWRDLGWLKPLPEEATPVWQRLAPSVAERVRRALA